MVFSRVNYFSKNSNNFTENTKVNLYNFSTNPAWISTWKIRWGRSRLRVQGCIICLSCNKRRRTKTEALVFLSAWTRASVGCVQPPLPPKQNLADRRGDCTQAMASCVYVYLKTTTTTSAQTIINSKAYQKRWFLNLCRLLLLGLRYYSLTSRTLWNPGAKILWGRKG